MEFVESDVIAARVNKQLRSAIAESKNSLPKFRETINELRRSRTRFMVVAFEEKGTTWIPVGIIVDKIEGQIFVGRRQDNDRTPIQETVVEVHESKVVDWTFVELWELQGGKMWRTVFDSLSKPRKIGAWNALFPFCKLEPPKKQTPLERALVDAIVNSDLNAFLTLHPTRNLTRKIWFAHISVMARTAGYVHISIQELIAIEATLDFIKSLQTHCDFDHSIDSPICDAALAGRLEIVKFFLDQGLSIESKNRSGSSLLDLGVSASRTDTSLWLIQNGATVNTQDIGGRTPLHSVTDPTIKNPSVGAKPFGRNPSVGARHLLMPIDAY